MREYPPIPMSNTQAYEAQVNYRKFIQERSDWEYTNVYADEGISGTNTKKTYRV